MVPDDCVPAEPSARPRMKMLPCPGPFEAIDTLGRYLMKSSAVETLSCLSVSAVIAWIVIGTFWMLSDRRCAVTTMSAISPSAGAAATAVPACALNTAMIA